MNEDSRAADSLEVTINILRIQNVCPRWKNPDFLLVDCWCHPSRYGGEKAADCPTKPEGWLPGMPGNLL